MARVSAVGFALLCVVGAKADDLAAARQMIGGALNHARQLSNIVFRLDGQVATSRTLSTFGVVATWQNASETPRMPAMLDANLYDNASLVSRYVGDGEYFWSYNAAQKQYSSTPYTKQTSLAQMFKSQARGQAALFATIAFDLFGRNNETQWAPWLPLARVEVQGSLIFLTQGDPATKQILIELEPPDDKNPTYRIIGIQYWETSPIGRDQRVTTWSLSLHPNVRSFEPGTFTFVPPRGSRAISMPSKGTDGL